MKKRNIGQLLLGIAVVVILVNGFVMGFNLIDRQVSSIVFGVALLLVVTGICISKMQKNRK